VVHGHQERPVRGHEPVLGEFLLLALRLQERQHPGLGFFDKEHNVAGAAPNDIELHPVTYIRFN
jgi:hypothetical protein